MKLQENIKRIKEMMGIITEQNELKKYAANVEPPILKKLKESFDKVIKGSYSAEGKTNAYDALHSFQSRASDKFGGRINTKVQNAIKEYKESRGIKAVDIKKVSVTIDPNTLTVNWEVTIGQSYDGYTYEEFDSRGSAGGGESAVDKQLDGMHSVNSGEPRLVYHYNKNIPICFNSNGTKKKDGCKGTINIQQKFYKYGKKVK
jgi:hypothetical protein